MTTTTASAVVFVIYDNPMQEVVRAYECQRDAQTFCDENNNWLGWQRYEVETDDAGNWADDEVRDA